MELSGFLAFWQLFILMLIGLMIYSLYHLGRSSLDSGQKLIWCLVIIFIPFGFVAYLLAKPYKSPKSQQ